MATASKLTPRREYACEALAQAGWGLDEAFEHTPDADIDAMVARVLEAYALHVRSRSERAA